VPAGFLRATIGHVATVSALHFTEDDEANALIARDPLALLIGFVLDQQVTVQKAFSSPLVLRERLGGLDAHRIAAMDRQSLEEVFREKPALHRFPGAMADRTQDLCRVLVERYDGDASRVWTDATDAREIERRLLELPGIGAMKAATLLAVLSKRLGLEAAGLEELLPKHPTLGDVDSTEALLAYQAAKRAHKAKQRALS
jgi:uncharacterized HhH-GPD family protein